MRVGLIPRTKGPAELRIARRLLQVIRRLHRFYGPQGWWPGDSPFEVIIGAILTQSASWANVEKALGNLKEAGVLSAAALRSLPLERLAQLIYPSGYYNAKAAKIRAFVSYLALYGDDLRPFFQQELAPLRRELLGIHGIGEETADSIILYAAGKPSFVIDAYTRRIFARLGLAPTQRSYRAFQALFNHHLPADTQLFNEYHALLVRHGKALCRKRPLCLQCPLLPLCPTGKALAAGHSPAPL